MQGAAEGWSRPNLSRRTDGPPAVTGLRRLAMLTAIGLLVLAGCRPTAGGLEQVGPGQSRARVLELAGEPDRQRTDILPTGGFFGPQEALVPLLAPGDPYEEWVYVKGETETYVWFAGPADDPTAWLVVLTASAPLGVVY